jgi:acetylglutamate kinase
MRVLKIGGNELERAGFLQELAQTLAALPGPQLIVHGGGKAVDGIQRCLGSEPLRVEGLRVTDEPALQAALMVLCGSVSKRLSAALNAAGVRAMGISGLDAGIIRVRKLEHPEADLGFVGRITQLDVVPLQALLQAGVTPLVAPLCLGPGGQIYNVNADQVAAALAVALGAASLDFLSNVPGVMVDGRPLPALDPAAAQALVEAGVITAGMLPKVRAAFQALAQGVPRVRLLDMAGLRHGGGTTFQPGADPNPPPFLEAVR